MVWCDGCSGIFHAHCYSVPLRQLDNPHLKWFCSGDCEHKHAMENSFNPRSARTTKRVGERRLFRGFHIVFDNVNWTIISTGQRLNMINYSIIEDRVDVSSLSKVRPR